MFHELIKSATTQHHQDAEKHSYGREIMSRTLTAEQYTELLIANYRYIAAWEKQWSNLPFSIPAGLQLESRKKVGLLTNDLNGRGIDVAQLPEFNLPPVNSFHAFMGRMYVIEGSTLGGAVIGKQLMQNTNLAGSTFHFYGAYGPMLMPNWKAFLAELNTIEDERDQQECIEAAKQCFMDVERCFIEAKNQSVKS